MKNLKKVLAMVLAFACTFSMFAGAKVFEDVPAGSDYSEAVTMLSDLGIIQGKDDGLYHPEDTITRAEACALIARMMTGDPDVSQYVGAQSFSDVQSGSWKDSAIGYCYINGIVIGVGNNKFEPDRAITDAEFITMVVRAMGYETADMKQNYPYSYMSNAQAIGLLDGTNMVASTDALRGEDAQVIYNALFTDYARGAMLVNTTHGTSVETYPTLAESVWGLTRAAVGTWNDKEDETATLEYCDAHTWVVIGADPDREGRILAYAIDDDNNDVYDEGKGTAYSFKYDGDVSSVVGYQVELWGEGNHGAPEWDNDGEYVWSEDWTIKAIKTVKGQTAYDYNASMVDDDDNDGTIDLEDASLDLDAVAANAKKIDENEATNSALTTYLTKEDYNDTDTTDAEGVETALNVRDGAQYKLVDWDSDGDVDWVVVSEANYYKVEAVNSTRVTVSSMKTGNEETQKASDSQTWKLNDLTEIDKVQYNFVTEEELAEGDIIEVTYNNAFDEDEDEEVVTATITKVEADTAELDKVSTKDTLELTFDGEVMKIAEANEKGDVVVPANPATYGDFDDEELGTSFNLWVNRNGFIVYSDYANETVNYLMILDTADGSDKTGDRKLAKADVLFADNSVAKDVEFSSSLTIDGEDDGTTGYDSDDRTWNETKVVGNVYKFWQNEDGVITKMEAMFTEDALSDNDYSYDESADRLKDASDDKIATLEEAEVLFAVTENFITETADSDKVGGYDVEADADKIMAVQQADIPEIVKSTTGTTNDTKADRMVNTTNNWLGATDADAMFIAEVDKNGEASAAILGVENFNKFNAANTTVGLVTSVSYDKNDVVEIEVAYKGEVTTVKSAEDVDFEDVVKLYNGSSDDELTTKEAAALLKDNALYAEVTTNADGVLTAVTFMDVDGNTATGHYYEVSRRIISDVTNSDVAYGEDSYYYYNNKNLYSVDRLNVEDKDLADEVYYYTIEGRPTTHNDEYDNVMLAVANGFDGTPDITAESDSNLIESYVNNKFDDVDDYQVADLVYKIDGDIVAAYAFEDSLGESDAEVGAVVSTSVTSIAAPKAGTVDHQIATWTAMTGAKTPDLAKSKIVGTVSGVTLKDVSSNQVEVTVAAGATGTFAVELYAADGTYLGKTKEVKVTATDVAAQAAVLGEETQMTAGVDAVAGSATITPDATQFETTGKVVTVTVDGKYTLTADIPAKATAAQILNLYQKEMLALNIADKYDYSVADGVMTITSKVPGEDVVLVSDDPTGVATATGTAAVEAVPAKYSAQVTTALHNGSVTVKIAQNGVESIATATTIEELTAENTAKLIADAFANDANFTVTASSDYVVAESKTAGAGAITIEVVK